MAEESRGHGEVVVQSFTGGAFAQNGFLVACVGSDAGILVDPGAAVATMLDAARAQGITVEAIVLTHAHLDHVEGVARAKRETGAPVWLHADDEELYHAAPVQAQWFGVQVEAPPPVDRYLAEGDTLRFGDCALDILHTPGHAPGHVILVGDGVALTGDCVFAGSIGRTDLPGGNLERLMDSIRRHILTLPDETVLFSGHGPETTVGHERTSNPFLVPGFGGSRFA